MNHEVLRVCPEECKDEPVIAEAEATMTGTGGVKG